MPPIPVMVNITFVWVSAPIVLDHARVKAIYIKTEKNGKKYKQDHQKAHSVVTVCSGVSCALVSRLSAWPDDD